MGQMTKIFNYPQEVEQVSTKVKRETSMSSLNTPDIGIGAGPAGQVLAGPLLFKVKIKCHFCKKQVMNRSASVIFRLVRLIILLYNR